MTCIQDAMHVILSFKLDEFLNSLNMLTSFWHISLADQFLDTRSSSYGKKYIAFFLHM